MSQTPLFDADAFLITQEPLTDLARSELSRATDEYRQLLEINALQRARSDGAPHVDAHHVRQARRVLDRPDGSATARRQGAQIIGGALVGAAISGVVALIPSGLEPVPVALVYYMLLGLGIALVFSAIGSRHRARP